MRGRENCIDDFFFFFKLLLKVDSKVFHFPSFCRG